MRQCLTLPILLAFYLLAKNYHPAGPTEGGWLVVAVWDTKDFYDRFLSETLMPTISQVSGGFSGPPQERKAEIVNLVTA